MILVFARQAQLASGRPMPVLKPARIAHRGGKLRGPRGADPCARSGDNSLKMRMAALCEMWVRTAPAKSRTGAASGFHKSFVFETEVHFSAHGDVAKALF